MNNKRLTVIVFIMAIVLFAAGCGDSNSNNDNANSGNNSNNTSNEANTDQNVSDEQSTITIGLDPYDYATVPAYLSQVILEQEGFDAKIEKAEVGILFQGLANGDIDAFIDIWDPNLHGSYIEKYEGQYENAGTLYSDMPLGMGVPTYMDDINSIQDVKDNPELFDNTLYAIEPGSGMGKTTDQMVKDYSMDEFEVNNSSVAGMMAQMKQSMEKEEPIVFNAWRPHPMFVNFDIKFLDDPKKSWKLDDVKVGVTHELKNDAPTAHTLFSNMELTLDMVEEWIMEVEDGKEPKELAEEWVDEHPDKVDKWLEK